MRKAYFTVPTSAISRFGAPLVAARTLLEQQGYEKTSMADIARAANVSEATIYKYFEHKRALMAQVLHAWMEPAIAALIEAVDLAAGARMRLRALCRQQLHGMARTGALHRIAYRELRWDDYYGSPFHRLNQRYTGVCLRVLAQGIRDNEIKPDIDPATVRDMIYGTLEHVGWRTILVGREIDIDATADRIADQIFAGIAVAAPQSQMVLPGLVARLEAAVATIERAAPGRQRPIQR
jgi:AcrR family transcriptional regulator